MRAPDRKRSRLLPAVARDRRQAQGRAGQDGGYPRPAGGSSGSRRPAGKLSRRLRGQCVAPLVATGGPGPEGHCPHGRLMDMRGSGSRPGLPEPTRSLKRRAEGQDGLAPAPAVRAQGRSPPEGPKPSRSDGQPERRSGDVPGAEAFIRARRRSPAPRNPPDAERNPRAPTLRPPPPARNCRARRPAPGSRHPPLRPSPPDNPCP